MKLPPITSEAEFDAAMVRLGEVFDAPSGTPECEEAEALADIIEVWDDEHHSEAPTYTPLDVISERMEDQGVSREEMVECLGSQAEVDAIFAGAAVDAPAAKKLAELLRVPESMLQVPTAQPAGH